MNADIVLWNLASLKVGAAAAFLQSGVFNWGRYWLLFGSSFLVITWLNLRFAIDTILLFHFKHVPTFCCWLDYIKLMAYNFLGRTFILSRIQTTAVYIHLCLCNMVGLW